MQNRQPALVILLLCLLKSVSSWAQSPSDAVMMNPGQICLGVNYSHDSWDEYWEGTLKRSNGNIGTLTRQTISPMFDLGIIDRLNVLGGVNYMFVHPSAGQVQGTNGFQDFTVSAKGDLVNDEVGSGRFHVLGSLTFEAPCANYVPDFMYSLGLGCIDLSLRPIVQYDFKFGLYARATGAYHIRGNSTLDRNYYYDTGNKYSEDVNMPDALDYSGVIGYWNKTKEWKAEAFYNGFNTLGGFDIRRQDQGFPSNKRIYHQVGADAEYYPHFAKGLGVEASYAYIISGRNVGQSTTWGVGASYFFQLWKTKK